MKSFITLVALLSSLSLVSTAAIEKRLDTSEHCGQWDNVVASPYTLYLDAWGKDNASSGSSCATLTSLSGTTIAWKNNWTWSGGSGVKSYTNINLNTGVGKQLSAISSIPAKWNWSQSTSSAVANIAFDLFTSSSATGSNQYEIMIWLANLNAGPISYNYDASGQPVPIVKNLSIAGKSWNLYYGSNGSNYVYSFLTSDGSTITSFSGDLKLFLSYLSKSQTLSSSQYLTTVQAGTEATSGSAQFTASAYSVVIQ